MKTIEDIKGRMVIAAARLIKHRESPTGQEMTEFKKKLASVDDPEKYKATDENFILARNRSKGLPIDEARQSFKSHFSRLVNLDKAPLDDLDKQIIEVRKSAIHRAQKQYIERQAKTLGVELPGRKRGRGM